MTDLLLYVLFLPLAGGVALLALPKERPALLKMVGLSVSLVTFLVSLLLYTGFDASATTWQFSRTIAWIPSLNITLSLGIDGISLLLILLTTFLTPIALLFGAFFVLTILSIEIATSSAKVAFLLDEQTRLMEEIRVGETDMSRLGREPAVRRRVTGLGVVQLADPLVVEIR